jgi:hypothetical protein
MCPYLWVAEPARAGIASLASQLLEIIGTDLRIKAGHCGANESVQGRGGCGLNQTPS